MPLNPPSKQYLDKFNTKWFKPGFYYFCNMSKQVCFILLLVSLLSSCSADKSTGIDFNTKNAQPLALFFINTECPVCGKYQGSFKPLIKRFSTRVRFYFV